MSASATPERGTFRPIVEGGPAWQRQLRDRFAEEGPPAGLPHLDLRRAVVRPVTYRFAEHLIRRYEWLGTMAKTNRHYGIFFGNACAGVTCVAVGGGTAGANAHQQFGIDRRDLAVLSRGACTHWAPAGTNSKLVAWTCRLLGRERIARLIMAFADTDAGEIGTIYQAANWVYIGQSKGLKTSFVAPNGRTYNRNIVQHVQRQNGGVAARIAIAALRRDGWRDQLPNPKHRYVFVLDRKDYEVLARVELKRLPFPKRGTGE